MPGTMMMKRPMMKKGGKALKPVKPSQKGLKKLPKKVRNKMGYMKNGGKVCLLYTSPSPRDLSTSRMPSSA